MSRRSNPPLQSELADWCREAGIDLDHSLLLTSVPRSTEIARIEEVAESVKAFGRVRVRDTRCGASPTTLLVLCECREAVDPTRCPIELKPTDDETWVIITGVERVPTSAVPAGFADKLSQFLRDEGKSMTDLQALFPPLSASPSSPESIIRAVGEILEKTVRPPSDSNAYRRLRTFSGIVPTPTGEEPWNIGWSKLK